MSDLDICARKLLSFIEDSVADGQRDPNPATALECYREADCTLGLLRKMLDREDQDRLTMLVVAGVFDNSFVLLVERGVDLRETLDRMAFAKTLFP
jgi:hypothetical protein